MESLCGTEPPSPDHISVDYKGDSISVLLLIRHQFRSFMKINTEFEKSSSRIPTD